MSNVDGLFFYALPAEVSFAWSFQCLGEHFHSLTCAFLEDRNADPIAKVSKLLTVIDQETFPFWRGDMFELGVFTIPGDGHVFTGLIWAGTGEDSEDYNFVLSPMELPWLSEYRTLIQSHQEVYV